MTSATPSTRPTFDLQTTFAALKYPNYRLWFMGQMVSLMGTWMQATAQGFLIFQLTQSPEYLGWVGFANGVPAWLFMLYAGVVADRISRRTVILIAQTVMMLLAFVLAYLTFTAQVQAWHILLLSFLLGTANAFDAPARVSFTLEMVDREDLTNAIALNATMNNTATAIGPAAAGLAYAALGPAWCFTLNGVSFIAVIIALALMKLKPLEYAPRQTSAFAELREGVRFVWHTHVIRALIVLTAAASLFGLAFVTLFPAWAVTVLHGDATTNGYLQSARGAGALIAALLIASLGRFQFKGRLIMVGSFVYPTLVVIFAVMRWLPLSLVALVGAGWGIITMFNLSNALLQTYTPDHLRGRTASVFTFSFFGLTPLGALLAGFAAERIGEVNTVIGAAVIALLIALLVYWRVPQVREAL